MFSFLAADVMGVVGESEVVCRSSLQSSAGASPAVPKVASGASPTGRCSDGRADGQSDAKEIEIQQKKQD